MSGAVLGLTIGTAGALCPAVTDWTQGSDAMSQTSLRIVSDRLATEEHSAKDIEALARIATQYERTVDFLHLVHLALKAAAANAIAEGVPYGAEVALLAQCEAFAASAIHDEFAALDAKCWAAIDAAELSSPETAHKT